MSDMDLIAALDRYGADLTTWPVVLAGRARRALDGDQGFARAFAEARALDRSIGEALAVREPPLGYATRLAARAIDAGRNEVRLFRARLALALGGGWAIAASVAGMVSANFLGASDPDMLHLAEAALGASSLVGN